MTRDTVHSEAAPGDALLPHVDADIGTIGRPGVKASVLGEDIVGLDDLSLMVGHPLGAVSAPRLLIGDREVDEVTLRTKPAIGQVPKGHSHRRREIQHVDCAPPPYFSLDQFATERIAIPAVRVDGHDVGVTHQTEARSSWIGAFDPGHQ